MLLKLQGENFLGLTYNRTTVKRIANLSPLFKESLEEPKENRETKIRTLEEALASDTITTATHKLLATETKHTKGLSIAVPFTNT